MGGGRMTRTDGKYINMHAHHTDTHVKEKEEESVGIFRDRSLNKFLEIIHGKKKAVIPIY